eukprot:GHVQ01003709.1.p1 GENE.GHVQ01003709.1~~GHVQ01003709.1.p1  ORF type:complete len:254 (+),score=26.99 GHVQ01003709.1:95-856(+)
MIDYQECFEQAGRPEHICGWYHSHPGYGCWLSGIDVQTQLLYQQHQEPFLAIVIDPIRTCDTGQVEIGAFRCYPSDYEPQNDDEQDRVDIHGSAVPSQKIMEFGMHYKRYYSLPVEIIKSRADCWFLDGLWASYWSQVFSTSALPTIPSTQLDQEAGSACQSEMAKMTDQLHKLFPPVCYNMFQLPCQSTIQSHNTTSQQEGINVYSGVSTQMVLKEITKQGTKLSADHIEALTTVVITARIFNKVGGRQDVM